MGILVGYSAWCGVVNMWSCSLSFRVLQSLFQTFAITFSTMAIFIGTPLYGPTLLYAGPASMIWGYVGVTFFTWFVGFAMAEICSSFPVRIILLLLRSSYFICLSLVLQRTSFIFLKTTPAAFCELDCQHSLKTWVFYFVDTAYSFFQCISIKENSLKFFCAIQLYIFTSFSSQVWIFLHS